jgi:hypothetical protein
LKQKKLIQNRVLEILNDYGIIGLDKEIIIDDLADDLENKEIPHDYDGKDGQVKNEIKSILFEEHKLDVDDAKQILEGIIDRSRSMNKRVYGNT